MGVSSRALVLCAVLSVSVSVHAQEGSGEHSMCEQCHYDCNCNSDNTDAACQACHHDCDGRAFCPDEPNEPPRCNFGALMGALDGAISANDLSTLATNPTYATCASVAAAIREADSCGAPHSDDDFECEHDAGCVAAVGAACNEVIVACFGEAVPFDQLEQHAEQAAEGTCPDHILECMNTETPADATACPTYCDFTPREIRGCSGMATDGTACTLEHCPEGCSWDGSDAQCVPSGDGGDLYACVEMAILQYSNPWAATALSCPTWGEYFMNVCTSPEDCSREPTDAEGQAFCAEFHNPDGTCKDDPNALAMLTDMCSAAGGGNP